jgi:two-component system, LytTR family, sensor histidine kinase AlgZ
MINQANPPTCNPTQDKQASQGFAALLVRAIWMVSGTTLFILLIFLSSGRIRLSQSGVELVGAFVYSATIGVPSIFLLNWLGHRYAGKNPRLVYLLYALALLCTATLGSLVGDLLLQMAGIVSRDSYWPEFRGSLPFAIVISLIFGLSISTFETMRYKLQATVLELRTRQVEQERAYKLLAEARLSSLESRIHPHFLFNTLNSIASLIPDDPRRAEDIVGKLASLLRFSLNANHSSLVPLGQELKIVRDYLEIEKTRFGPRLCYEIEVPASLQSANVPPLALQSLVENCVKHVVTMRQQGGEIRVSGSSASGRILLEVIDDGPGFSLETIPPDHGLANLIARLQLLFGEAGCLEVIQEEDRNCVRLSFPTASLE